MPVLTVVQGQTRMAIPFEGTPLLKDALLSRGVPFGMPCGGKGLCGQCRVTATGELSPPDARERELGARLACRARLLGDATVTLPVQKTLQNIAATGERPVFAHQPMPGRYGLAVDIGTTTLAATLLSLTSGAVLATAAAENPQRGLAADVIGRMEASMAGNAARLQTLVTGAVDRLRGELCAQAGVPAAAVDQAVVTGNTTMLYLLTGRNPEPLSHAPFAADCLFGGPVPLGGGQAYAPRCMGAFVGADITCALLASRLCQSNETALLADVGTNGELALWHRGKLYVCATAAGPAFEGGGLSCGCGSVAGAVERVWAQDGQICCATIGAAPPAGLCGSGVIDAVAVLLALGRLDETGLLAQDRVLLTGDVALTGKDVRQVQLAKSAIAAGMLTLCDTVGIPLDAVATLYLAGGFGGHINLKNAAAIGLIPQALVPKTKGIGNAALVGAEMLLLQTDFLGETEAFAKNATVVALGGSPVFAENYMNCMMLEPISSTGCERA